MTVRGANRLAIEGLPMLPCMPTTSRLETTGFSMRAKEGVFWTWPIWRDPLSLDACESLLALAELQQKAPDGQMLAETGILTAYRCQRITIGKFRNFTHAEAI